MPIGYKRRKWQAFLSISASGPEFSPLFEECGRFFRPRMSADLRYTTADIDFLERYFREQGYDSGEFEKHIRLRNPSVVNVEDAIDEIAAWFDSHRAHSEWDGGGIQVTFAGHGAEPDGSMVLEDGKFTPDYLIEKLAAISGKVSSPGRLRISVVMDSCHSGAFAAQVLNDSLSKYSKMLVPFNVVAGCNSDEFAWEESSLGHGVFTYCLSVRQHVLGGVGATAIQPDNTTGPSVAIAAGRIGVALLTAGAQNPVYYLNGTGEIEIGAGHFKVVGEDGHVMPLGIIEEHISVERERFAKIVCPMRPDVAMGRSSDAQMRSGIRKLHEELLQWKAQRLNESPQSTSYTDNRA